jgi:DNA polymerase III psi subunit
MLKIEGTALQQFFNGHTLYKPKTNDNSKTITFNYEGENNKYIVMLFSHTDSSAMPEAQKPFLEKILNATKLSFSDVALVNLNNYPDATLKQLKEFFAATSLFFWGINPSIFNIKAQLYQPLVHEKLKIISVDPIDVIEKDKALKAKLWGILQTHYLK